ncbi:MAG TPA: hypothetical protein DC047_03505 [Blastocatellia bacterium]|nr:hypothetical protein [Blastocatellia bacterium]
MIIKRFNKLGLERFNDFLDSLTGEEPLPVPSPILEDPHTTEDLPNAIEIKMQTFASRLEAARYLYDLLADSGIPELDRDRGIWAWLSLYFFDQLCPVDKSGKRKPGDRARWIPATSNFRKYYRHLLAGPFRIYRTHRDNPDRALALLSGPLSKPGEIAEQISARQELVTNRAVVELATNLYIDRSTRRPRRGAAGKGPGSARRLADVLQQFDVTWNLYMMEALDLMGMMPQEFSKFLPAQK